MRSGRVLLEVGLPRASTIDFGIPIGLRNAGREGAPENVDLLGFPRDKGLPIPSGLIKGRQMRVLGEAAPTRTKSSCRIVENELIVNRINPRFYDYYIH